VVPVYGCRDCIRALHERLTAVLTRIAPSYEIVLVDDRSPDDAWPLLRQLADEDRRVTALRLSRNFGQHAAITAGLRQSCGELVVVMDCDLQDPPEEIPRLVEAARGGYDIVFARRMEKKHSLFRRLSARTFFWLINLFNRTSLDGAYGSFSIISRKVVEAFLRLNDRDRHYLLILNWLGFRTGEIEYLHADRGSGRSSYTFTALIKHAFDGIFFQTTVLLRWITYLGFFVSMAGVALTVFFVYLYFAHSVVPGWTSLVVLILLVGGFIITSTGITGLYIGKIFDQVRERPLYVIDQIESRERNQ
jgi:dolichol-phosphate mannosyltransferase